MLLTVLPLCLLVCHVLAQGDGDIRLVSSTSTSSTGGRLEINWNGVWGTVCDDGFNFTEAQVVCQQLGYTEYISYGTATDLGYSSGLGQILLDQVNCSSSSFLHILQCSHNALYNNDCSHSEDIAVVCSSSRLEDNPYRGQIRLVGGSYPSRGLVEVFCGGEWGTVCDDSFSGNDALTVCRQLGYNDYDAYDTGTFSSGSSSQPIWLDNLPCSSSDVCILECERCPSGHNCDHSEDVDIFCSYTLNIYYSTPPARLTTCEVYANQSDTTDQTYTTGPSAAGTIAGIVIGVLAGAVILAFSFGIGIYCYVRYSKKKTPRLPVTQNVQTTANTSPAQVTPSSYPEQPPAPNPQVAYVAQHPVAYPVQTQARYPIQLIYPAQVMYTVQAPSSGQGQPQEGVCPVQTTAQCPVTASEGDTATLPPSSTAALPPRNTAALPPSNPELFEPPPPSYNEVQKEYNTPSPQEAT